MAITRAQQVRQMLEDGGRLGLFRGALADTKGGRAMSPGTSADYSPGQGNRQDREKRGGPPGGGDPKMKYTAPPKDYDRSKDTGPDRFKLAEQNRIKAEEEARRKKENDRIAKEAMEAFQKREIERKALDRRKKMGAKLIRKRIPGTLEYEEAEKDDYASGAMMDLFLNDPKTRDMPAIGTIKGLEPLLDAGAMKTRGFFADDVLSMDPKRFERNFGLTPEEFRNASLTRQNEIYGRYMDNRLSNRTDAFGNPLMGGRDGQDQPIIPVVPTTTGIASTAADTTGTTAASDTSDLDDYIAQMREGAAYRFFADGGRADDEEDYVGGIMDLETSRQMYGLGKLVKKVTRGIKKIAKSPVGKIALLAGGAGLLSKGGFGLPSFLSKKGLSDFFFAGKPMALKNLTQRGLLTGIGGLSAFAGLMTPKQEEDEDTYLGPTLDIAGIRQNPYAAMGETYRFAADGGLMRQNYAEGSKEPVAKKTMPLLDMDGMEKDYRADGGFVPIGRMERADDVPARLSKNEFVFTADAVRNAGDGDVDKGAEVMYNMMKNLEAGGNVSEESQGLDGARKMFQTSQRLEEVL